MTDEEAYYYSQVVNSNLFALTVPHSPEEAAYYAAEALAFFRV